MVHDREEIIGYDKGGVYSPSFLDKFDEHYISGITYMEILGYRFKENREESFIKEMLDVFSMVFIDLKLLIWR